VAEVNYLRGNCWPSRLKIFLRREQKGRALTEQSKREGGGTRTEVGRINAASAEKKR